MWRSHLKRKQWFRQALTRENRGPRRPVARREAFRTSFPIGLLMLWILFLGVFTYVVVFSPFLMITEVEVRGMAKVPSMRLRETIETVLTQKRFGVVSQRNYLFVSHTALEQALLTLYPLVHSVTLEQQFPHRLIVSVTERDYLTLWCSGGPCYLLDDLSRARTNERVWYTLSAPWRLTVIDTSALPVGVGEELAVVGEYLRYFTTLYHEFPTALDLQIVPTATTPSRFSHELRVTTEAGWDLLVNTELPVDETLSVVRGFLEQRLKTGRLLSPLVLVDTRVPGRIFYTETNATTPQEAAVVQEVHD